jgi:hypothetical protein
VAFYLKERIMGQTKKIRFKKPSSQTRDNYQTRDRVRRDREQKMEDASARLDNEGSKIADEVPRNRYGLLGPNDPSKRDDANELQRRDNTWDATYKKEGRDFSIRAKQKIDDQEDLRERGKRRERNANRIGRTISDFLSPPSKMTTTGYEQPPRRDQIKKALGFDTESDRITRESQQRRSQRKAEIDRESEANKQSEAKIRREEFAKTPEGKAQAKVTKKSAGTLVKNIEKNGIPKISAADKEKAKQNNFNNAMNSRGLGTARFSFKK